MPIAGGGLAPGGAVSLTPAERLIVQALIINDLTPFAGADIAAILADVTGIAGAAMRGTDGAAVPGDQMALTAAERLVLQALTLSDATPFAGASIAAILADVTGIAGAAMRGTDNAELESDASTRYTALQADLDNPDQYKADVGAELYGSGADGDVTIAADTEVTQTMYYDDLTVDAGQSLTLNDATRGSIMILFVKGILTVNGSINVNGKGAAGGAGGAGGGDSGAGGAGGAGAGLLLIFAKTVVVGAAGDISGNGVDGTVGGDGTAAGGSAGSGGGGGAGGRIILITSSYTNAGTVQATGGSGGAAGTRNVQAGNQDVNGTIGTVGTASILFGATYGTAGGGSGGTASPHTNSGGGGGGSFRAAGGAGGNRVVGVAGTDRSLDYTFPDWLATKLEDSDNGGGGGGGGGGGAENDGLGGRFGSAGGNGAAGVVHVIEP